MLSEYIRLLTPYLGTVAYTKMIYEESMTLTARIHKSGGEMVIVFGFNQKGMFEMIIYIQDVLELTLYNTVLLTEKGSISIYTKLSNNLEEILDAWDRV